MSDAFTNRLLGHMGRKARDPRTDAMSGPILVMMGAMLILAITAGMNRER